MGAWRDPEKWRKLRSGESCPICLEGEPRDVIYELEAGFLTSQPEQLLPGYCCLVARRHVVELHDLTEDEAAAFMRDLRRVGRALQEVTEAVKINVDIHGNVLPHLHAHFFPRRPGDRFEDGPIDSRYGMVTMDPEDFEDFVGDLRAALAAALVQEDRRRG